MPPHPNCKVAREGRLLRVTIARPQKRNALDLSLCRALVETIESASPSDTGAILLDAEGPSFCSGMDLDDSLTADPAELAAIHERLFTLASRVTVPIVAAVQGHAIAGGLGVVANAHIVIAAEDAKFGLTEVRVGMWPFLIFRSIENAVGPRAALELSLTGRILNATQALDAGLVHEIAPLARAHEVATELAGRLPDAVRLGLQYFGESRGLDFRSAGALAARLRTELIASPGYAEAVRQFREKKKQ